MAQFVPSSKRSSDFDLQYDRTGVTLDFSVVRVRDVGPQNAPLEFPETWIVDSGARSSFTNSKDITCGLREIAPNGRYVAVGKW